MVSGSLGQPESDQLAKYLGPLEAQVMQVLWERGNATVRDVWDALVPTRPLAYTTVMTVLSRLTEKDLLVCDTSGRAYSYRPAMTREEFLSSLSSRMVGDAIAQFGEMAIAQFVEHLRRLDPERIQELLRLMEAEPSDKRE